MVMVSFHLGDHQVLKLTMLRNVGYEIDPPPLSNGAIDTAAIWAEWAGYDSNLSGLHSDTLPDPFEPINSCFPGDGP
jgi:hypothetical protein